MRNPSSLQITQDGVFVLHTKESPPLTFTVQLSSQHLMRVITGGLLRYPFDIGSKTNPKVVVVEVEAEEEVGRREKNCCPLKNIKGN